jgi:16S rRNA (guanine527-N7)-methyltransferase
MPDERRPQPPDHSADLTADRDQVLAAFHVSRETVSRLDRFAALLLIWQKKINLIGPSTVSSLWSRHIGDSLQLLSLVHTGRTAAIWVDLGSGAGFPGLVIACALADVEGAQVHLIESNAKKAAFLREAIRETGAPATVHAGRIEELGPRLAPGADVVTARALAPLPELLALTEPFLTNGAQALLLKGQDVDAELTEAAKYWIIEADIVPSRTSAKGRILIVRGLSRR